ncbi:MAG: lipopolysaccharide biosynthesis protein [Phycisphaerae bacterium]
MNLRRYFQIEPVATPGGAAASYVPVVFASRGLAFLRLLIVGRLLGEAGKAEFGLYQPAQELVNWIVPVALFGLADVAERYASRFEKEGRLRPWLRRHYLRLLATAIPICAALMLLAPWLGRTVLHLPPGQSTRSVALLAECALTISALALYQHLAAVLRGLRAYGASAGLEITSALLLFIFAALAAWRGGALALMAAYAASVLLAFSYYAVRLLSFLHATEPATSSSQAVAPSPPPTFRRFALWTFLRLLLMMTFNAVSILGVGALDPPHAAETTANYAMPYRIAQLLAYVAATLWASTYGIAARAWSHGQVKRAHVQLFRVGKWGGILLTLVALGVMLLRPLLGLMTGPSYVYPIQTLLPPLLGVFLWYGLLAFWSLYADLHEKPALGACMWAGAVCMQLAFLFAFSGPPESTMARACGFGLLCSLLVVVPLSVLFIERRPTRMTATGVPLALLTLAPLSLFVPPWLVNLVAIPVLLGTILFLWISGLMIRPTDRRAWRRRFHPAARSEDADMLPPGEDSPA